MSKCDFNKVALKSHFDMAATLLKKRPLHRCFPVNFVKFLRTPFLKEHLRWLLLFSLTKRDPFHCYNFGTTVQQCSTEQEEQLFLKSNGVLFQYCRWLQFNLEKNSSKVLLCEICETFQNSFLLEQHLGNDSFSLRPL